ncbi:hypothetical protein O3674_15810 [Escherichia coli]|uniref:hypothetical protein n=1 Tax=Escherichia coli TaxID=562 RepID=UPI002738111E|nr:hypothetical protein [Escherichia coli]MDP4444056.1 hypothetical protein [Escherichia coli]
MKSTTGINQQISKVQSAIMALKATNTDVQSITIRGNKPVIRVSRSAHCMRMLEQGNPPCRTRLRRIRQSQVGDTASSVFYEYFREFL